MESIIEYLVEFRYFAMFLILLLCGIGLPIPEEVTLIGSGLLVGWNDASFLLASSVCIVAIILGDSIPFFLGKLYGQRFLRWMLSEKRLKTAGNAFEYHRLKTVFFARFVTGFRIPVYAYAGSSGMSWFTFAGLDCAGSIILVPISIWIGKFAAENFAENRQEALKTAQDLSGQFHFWLLLVLLAIVALVITLTIHRWTKKKLLDSVVEESDGENKTEATESAASNATASHEASATEKEDPQSGTPDREDREDA